MNGGRGQVVGGVLVCWLVCIRVSIIDSLRGENSISNQDYRCRCTTGTTTGVHMGSTRHTTTLAPAQSKRHATNESV